MKIVRSQWSERSKRVVSFALNVLLFVFCSPVDAPAQNARVGFLATTGQELEGRTFQQGLLDLGYIEGKNILVEYRYVAGKPDSIPSIVEELVKLKVDVLVATNPPAIRAAKQSTKTIPIVMVTTQDPVATGLIDSLARPGGNLTGVTQLTRDLSGKRLELLKDTIPTISRVGVLTVAGPSPTGLSGALKEYETAARLLKIPIQSLQVARGPNPDLDGAFREAINGGVSAIITARNNVLTPHRNRIVDLALKNRLPSLYEATNYVEVGGLMSYGANDTDLFHRAAIYVDKILKGAKPSELPVEQPTKFELVINLKTAKQIGVTIPPPVLARADKVIR